MDEVPDILRKRVSADRAAEKLRQVSERSEVFRRERDEARERVAHLSACCDDLTGVLRDRNDQLAAAQNEFWGTENADYNLLLIHCLIQGMEGNANNVEKYERSYCDMWALGLPEGKGLPEHVRDITQKYWNANTGPYSRWTQAILSAAKKRWGVPEPEIRRLPFALAEVERMRARITESTTAP